MTNIQASIPRDFEKETSKTQARLSIFHKPPQAPSPHFQAQLHSQSTEKIFKLSSSLCSSPLLTYAENIELFFFHLIK